MYKLPQPQNVKLTMVTVPFQGHCKILTQMAQKVRDTHPNFEITFIITGWKNVQATPDEIEKLKSLGIKVVILNDDENIPSSAPMKFTFPRVSKLTDTVIENCKHSDFIIYDFFSPEGYIAGKQLNIPAVCSMPAIMGEFNKQNPLFQKGMVENEKYLNLLNKKYQLQLHDNLEMVSDGFFLPSDFKNIIWTWPGLMQTKDYLKQRKHIDNYVFMRPAIDATDNNDPKLLMVKDLKKQGKKLIYFSLGTVVTKNLWDHENAVKSFVNQIFETLLKKYANHHEYEIVISTGRPIEDLAVLKDIPSNFHVYESVPQREMLKDCDLFITHAGGNSVNDAIDANIPMVAIPFFGDQHVCADYIAKNHLGISFLHEEKNREIAINTQAKLFFRSSFTEENFVSAIETVLSDNSYKKSVEQIKSCQPATSTSLIDALQNLKTLNWKEGDLLFGCNPDRYKLAELTQTKSYFRLGDKRSFSTLFPNKEAQNILPRIVDQYHDVITCPLVLAHEVVNAKSKIYRETLQEYRDFLLSHPQYLQPIGCIDQITPDKGHAYLETLWSMCLGGLEFFTTVKHKTIHFMVGTFNDKLSEATAKELQWIKQHYKDENVRKYIKFYIINHGLIKEVDPIAMYWFSSVRPTPSLLDVAPEKLNQQNWHQLKKELHNKAHQINPHRFFNHFKQCYSAELEVSKAANVARIDVLKNPEKAKQLLRNGEVYSYTMLPHGELYIMKKHVGTKHISHAVVAENQDVICAGEVRMRHIIVNGKMKQVLDLSNSSGHYQPTSESLPKVISAFEKLNLPVYRVTVVHPKLNNTLNKVEEELPPVYLQQAKMI